MADPTEFDTDEAIDMELQPGEFFLFTERTLHRSAGNTSDTRRLGMSPRATVPFAFQDPEESYNPNPERMVLSGEDYVELNETVEPPARCTHS